MKILAKTQRPRRQAFVPAIRPLGAHRSTHANNDVMCRHLPFSLLLLTFSIASDHVTAQDLSYPAFGNPTAGTPFQATAPQHERIQSIAVRHGAYVDQLVVYYEDRYGALTGLSGPHGGGGGMQSWFNIADNDYLLRIDLWYDLQLGVIHGIQLGTRHGQTAMYGSQAGAHYYYQAVVGPREIIGLHGTAGPHLYSLGVVTRPVLASRHQVGTGCPASCGNFEVQLSGQWIFPAGSQNQLLLGQLTRVRTTCSVLPMDLVAIAFEPLPTAIPLPLWGSTGGCTLHVSPSLLFVVGYLYHLNLNVPNNANLVGSSVWFQGFSDIGSPTFGTTPAVSAMIGVL